MRHLKVTIKKEDKVFNIYPYDVEDAEPLSLTGFETEDQALHSATTKGYTVVGEKGKPKDNKFTELPNTVDQRSNGLKVPTEASLLKSIVKEILSEISKKKVLSELEVTDPEIIKKIEEMARLSDEMDRVKNELAKLKKLFEPLDEEITKLMDEADKNGERALETKTVLVTIKKRGNPKVESPKYKESFEQLYAKVNAAMKKQADEIKAKNMEYKKVSTSLAVQYKKQTSESMLSEESLFTKVLTKIKTYFAKTYNNLVNRGKQIDSDINKLKQLV